MRATSRQEAVSRERHVAPVAVQTEHAQTARANPELRASTNHGKPPVETNSRPEVVNGHQGTAPTYAEASKSSGTLLRTESERNRNQSHQTKLSPGPLSIQMTLRLSASRAGKLRKRQSGQEVPTATGQHDCQAEPGTPKPPAEAGRRTSAVNQQKANDARTQQVEQKHQQQTQQMSNKHATQQQSMQSRQPQPKPQQGHPDQRH